MHVRHANNSQNLLLNFESVANPGTRILVQTNAAGIAHVADERDARALVATGVFAWIDGDPAIARAAAAEADAAAALAAFDAAKSAKDEKPADDAAPETKAPRTRKAKDEKPADDAAPETPADAATTSETPAA